MATVDELIKELREKTKTKNSETKDASLAFNREVKTMIANMAGIEVKCPVCGSTERVKDGEGRFKLTKECDCMTWLYLVVMIFSALTLYFTYGEYKQNRFSRKAFTLVSIMEAVVIVATTVMLIMSL